jgi:predicted GNAT family acetyltransferase
MTEVRNDPAKHRYEVFEDGAVAGFAEYMEVHGGRIVFTHTEMDPKFEGQGLGTKLIAGALDDARDRDQQIVPICPFVARYVHKHPQYVPFLDERIRKAFE